ncbi:PEP-CTERM sorting domain-containing protein [Spirulina sp. CS-785/01]|uniref:PEP-CTERM sorting domain-containing protein n=1 Tax=Spirulina sp. CS-785/01 TaxID=3021716 RepID=UPI00232D0369|nr:PEP-CTERM sorting domain-containing protein [Spirulina sp. CS-785/01]MDB9314365.1 PEP-CTERM sorting domain-containing protein [Spirulina sp. CS-785/01]
MFFKTMLFKTPLALLATTLLTCTSVKVAHAASLYSATQLPGTIPNMQWVEILGADYLMNGFDLNNSGQASYSVLTPYGVKRNDSFEDWSSLWDQNVSSSLLRESFLLREGQQTLLDQETLETAFNPLYNAMREGQYDPPSWDVLWRPEVLNQMRAGNVDALSEEQQAVVYNYLTGGGIPGLLGRKYIGRINRSSYLWDTNNTSHYLGQGEVTGISESGWATFNNDLGGSFAYNLNTQEHFLLNTGSDEHSRSYFTSINDQNEVAVKQNGYQSVLSLASPDYVISQHGKSWDDGEQSLWQWNFGNSSPYLQGQQQCHLTSFKPCGYDMNQLGQVVGGGVGAFLWEDGEFYDLNNLVADWEGNFAVATAINDQGQMLAIASSGTLGLRGDVYLLNPISEEDPKTVPEPSSILGILALGLLGIFSRRQQMDES